MSGVEKQSEEAQVNTLMYSTGDQADNILHSFGLSEDDSKKYTIVKAKFDSHFVKRRNRIFERAKFNMRRHRMANQWTVLSQHFTNWQNTVGMATSMMK